MIGYFADKRTGTNKKNIFPYIDEGSDDEAADEKELCSINYTDSCDLKTYKDNHIDKKQINRPLAKFGKSLSDTISRITHESKCKPGNKIELIIEIEIFKCHPKYNSNRLTPTSSIVEVTVLNIVPYKRSEMKKSKVEGTGRSLPFRLFPYNSENETASTKRRKWFERVVYNQSVQYNTRSIARNAGDFQGGRNNSRYSAIKYLNSQWCERNVDSEIKSYKVEKIIPKPRKRLRDRRFRQCETSKGFLPASKVNKTKEVEQAFSELKEKVGNIMQVDNVQNVNAVKKKRGPIPALGKLVSNIIVEVIERVNSNKNSIKASIGYPPVPKKYVKHQKIGYNGFCRIVSDSSADLKRNEVIQILKPRTLYDESKIELNVMPSPTTDKMIFKQSNKQNDCGLNLNISDNAVNKQNQTSPRINKNIAMKVKQKYQDQNNKIQNVQVLENKHEQKIYEDDNLSTGSSEQSWVIKIEKKKKRKPKNEKNCPIKKDIYKLNKQDRKTIEVEKCIFNGKSLRLGNELKKKIETLIVSELQNLALKEGMDCDISLLSSSSESVNYNLNNSSLEVESFLCEVDLTDNTIERIKSNLRRANDKKREDTSPIKYNDTINNEVLVQRLSKMDPLDNSCINMNEQSFKNKFVNRDKLQMKSLNEREEKQFEITYFNPAVKNWSKMTDISDYSETSKTVLDRPKVEPDKRNSKNGFVKKLLSNDTIWKNANFRQKSITNSTQGVTETIVSKASSSNENQNSETTNEYYSNIEIELDVKGLEDILEHAHANGINDSIVISATRNKKKKCKHKSRSVKRNKSKNTSSYTEAVLTEAVKKLELHLKKKEKKKHSKR